jgi:hypothetical protein
MYINNTRTIVHGMSASINLPDDMDIHIQRTPIEEHNTLFYWSYISTLSQKQSSSKWTSPTIIWSLNLPSSVKPATCLGSVPLLAPGPLNLGVSIMKLYLASGSYFRAMTTKIAHMFPLNKTSRWTND